MPTLDRIAKTIVGPNEAHHVGPAKLLELQDLKWGRLKSQEQAHFLRAARFVLELFENEAKAPPAIPAPAASNGAPISGGPDHAPTPPPLSGAPVLGCDDRSAHHLLMQFRAYVSHGVISPPSNHPIWADVAAELDEHDLDIDPKSGPDWVYIQPDNRRSFTDIREEFNAKGGNIANS